MLKLEKRQYLNSIFQLNFIRKKSYDTELFVSIKSTNFVRHCFL